MTLDAGSRLGPYEIMSPLGAGGMGEVYKARDTRLDRVVAVKVLPEALAADPQVSANGGVHARWRGDGRELFFLEGGLGPTLPGKLMAVDVGASQSSFERGAPRLLFDSQYVNFQHPPGTVFHPYAVSRDGQRFLIPRLAASSTENVADAPVAIVVNWASSLPRK